MSRFFYPASRAHHAYCMAIDHGMRFKMRNGFWTLEGLSGMGRAGSYRIEVAEECLHLLEPQVGDLVQNPDGLVARVCESPVFRGEVALASAKEFVGTAATIIQRNGVAFYWPESEQ